MLYLSDQVPAFSNDRPFPIVRVPATKPLVAIATTAKPLGTPTHFWGGRTLPCTRPNCEPCANGVAYRFHLYTCCYDHRTQLHFLLELTGAAAEPLLKYGREHGTCRGCGIHATRIPATINGRIHIKTTPTDPNRYPIPSEADLATLLSRLWNIPLTEISIGNQKTILPEILVTNCQETIRLERKQLISKKNGSRS